jgi:hypothetical protein
MINAYSRVGQARKIAPSAAFLVPGKQQAIQKPLGES